MITIIFTVNIFLSVIGRGSVLFFIGYSLPNTQALRLLLAYIFLSFLSLVFILPTFVTLRFWLQVFKRVDNTIYLPDKSVVGQSLSSA